MVLSHLSWDFRLFAAINSATKGASDAVQQAASTSAKSISTASEASTKALAKASESIADAADDAASVQQTIAAAAKRPVVHLVSLMMWLLLLRKLLK